MCDSGRKAPSSPWTRELRELSGRTAQKLKLLRWPDVWLAYRIEMSISNSISMPSLIKILQQKKTRIEALIVDLLSSTCRLLDLSHFP